MPSWKRHARPLLDVVAAAGEVDAVDAADAPLGIGEAARVAVHDRVVGHARAERVVLAARSASCGALALLLGVGARALLGAALARGGRGDLDGVAGDLAAARLLGELLELVGGLVDRLQVALVLELLAGRRDVRVPALGQPAARELDVALVERRLDLQEEDGLLDVQHLRHDRPTVASGRVTRVPSALASLPARRPLLPPPGRHRQCTGPASSANPW